jgi:hypothetical protein
MWELADLLVDQDHPGDFNQSLMELGRWIIDDTFKVVFFGAGFEDPGDLISRGTLTRASWS